jgi:hypothetical protein
MNIINGFIENVTVVPTTADTHMVTFILGREPCKAFNNLANMVEALQGQEVQAEGFWRPCRDDRELDVRSIRCSNAASGFVTIVE